MSSRERRSKEKHNPCKYLFRDHKFKSYIIITHLYFFEKINMTEFNLNLIFKFKLFILLRILSERHQILKKQVCNVKNFK